MHEKKGSLPAAVRAIFESANPAGAMTILPATYVPVISPAIDGIANKLFDQFRDEGTADVSIEECRRQLSAAARKLLQLSGAEREAIQSSLDELPEEQRDAVMLHLEGLTYKQVARRKGVDPEDMVKIIAKGYARIRLKLE